MYISTGKIYNVGLCLGRVSDCCLKIIQQFFSYISWQEQVIFQCDDDEIRFVLSQHA